MTQEPTPRQRLSKAIAQAGFVSRRAAEKAIFAGDVLLNGKTCYLPQQMVVLGKDLISFKGVAVKKKERKVYYLLHKPVGMLCSSQATPNCKRLVIDLFKDLELRLFTVGRLDKETSGLLLITNDGHFANSVIHPRYQIQKEYIAHTNKEITEEHLTNLRKGCLVESTFVKPHRVTKVRKGTVKIVVLEGKKREVREILAQAGLKTLQLKRVRIGNLHLGKIAPGKWRAITEKEKQELLQPKKK